MPNSDINNSLWGHYQQLDITYQDYLTLVFSPSSFSLKERWRNNSLSASFLADYFSNFFPGENSNLVSRAEIKSLVKYIANELLENAVKFNYDASYRISLTLYLNDTGLLFSASNSVNEASLAYFQTYIKQLLEENPLDLYVQKLEYNAAHEDEGNSGLGLITMLTDYNALLGWKFEEVEARVAVTTQVLIKLQNEANQVVT